GFSFFCAWSYSPAGSRHPCPVSLRFSSIPSKTDVPARSGHVPVCRTDGHTFGAAISYGWFSAACGYCGQTAHGQRQAGWCCTTKEKRKAKSLENTVFSRLSRTLLSMVEISGIEPLTS